MPHRTFNVEELTAYLHLARGDVERLMREADLPHTIRGGKPVFMRGEVDAWASRRILGMTEKRLEGYHEKSARGTKDIFPGGALIPELLRPEYIDLALTSRTRASVIRDMVALAGRTGRVLDPRELVTSIEEREAMCTTAQPGGLALLHPRHHAAYRFEGSFVVFGRTVQPVPFGAPDGRPTDLFFLVCCEDDRIHLHTLARLCLIFLNTDVLNRLVDAPDAATAYEMLVAAELEVLPPPPEAPKKTSRRG